MVLDFLDFDFTLFYFWGDLVKQGKIVYLQFVGNQRFREISGTVEKIGFHQQYLQLFCKVGGTVA